MDFHFFSNIYKNNIKKIKEPENIFISKFQNLGFKISFFRFGSSSCNCIVAVQVRQQKIIDMCGFYILLIIIIASLSRSRC